MKPPNRVAFAVPSNPDTCLNASEGSAWTKGRDDAAQGPCRRMPTHGRPASLAVIFVLMSSDGLWSTAPAATVGQHR